MAKSYEVLGMLRPDGGYVQVGEDFEGIKFIDCAPLTKKEYEDGFLSFDKWKAEQDLSHANRKQTLLNRLGITAEEAVMLLA